jgi:NAD(P)-dependent dehydrogenase (short-subunit alcohol dehydrogenase family)
MIIDLTGLRAVVTGSTSGIGFAIARGLAGSGAAVVINGRSQKNVDSALARLAKELPQAKVEGVTADLATADGGATFVAQVPAADILVNNLGIFEPKPFGEISDADWLRFFETNVMSGVRMSRHYLPGMVAKGWGRVVFISSESGLFIPTEMIHYGTTKTAQLAISRPRRDRRRHRRHRERGAAGADPLRGCRRFLRQARQGAGGVDGAA